MSFWDEDEHPRVADGLEIHAKWVGMDGWKLVIKKRHLGESWAHAGVELYEELDAAEMLQVLDSSLGRWFAI